MKLFVAIVLVLVALSPNFCHGGKNSRQATTERFDDSDFGISLLDLDENNAKNESSKGGKENGLAGAIVRAVKDFQSDKRSSTVDLRSIFGFGFGDIFGFGSQTKKKTQSKRSVDDFLITFAPKSSSPTTKELDFDDWFDESSSSAEKRNESSVDVEEESQTPRSNINKIPKKQKKTILSRRTKSVDSHLVKVSENNATRSESDSKVRHDEDYLEKSLSSSARPDFVNASGIEGLLDVYSVQRLIRNWDLVKRDLNPTCGAHMAAYLAALIRHTFWALKMDDASGRYTSGYFWGNSYWSGSSTLCMRTLTPSIERANDSHLENTTQMLEFEDEQLPFEVAFYLVKLRLNSTITIAGPKILYLGLCLPEACMSEDVQKVVKSGGSTNKVQIVNIRDPTHNHYDMFSDITFQILVGVSVVISILIIVGTIYELVLSSRYKKYTKIKQKNHALHLNMSQVTDLPNVKMSNGKSIYAVNGITNNNNNSEERLNIEVPVVDEQPQLSTLSELILSFSLISNMKSICDQSVGSDTIPTIHGLRSISMVWVILGHACIVAFKYSDNPELRKDVEKEFLFQTVTNGTFSVDTFFCISGILVSFIYFRTNAKGSLDRLTQGTRGFTSGFLQFIGLLAYRFARLTAPYMFMLGVVQVSMKWFHYNSVYEPPTDDHINCPNYWWRNALYINTLFPVEQMCMLWSWYLADDSQFYVLGAIILILAASHFKTAAVALVLFLCSSWMTTGYIAWSNNHVPSSDDPLALFDKIYDKPWTRLGPYLIGMATGWFLFKIDCRMKMTKLTIITGWVISSAVLLGLIYGLYNTELGPISAAAYSSLSHTAWAIAISWIVIACSTGYGGYVNSLLSATILYPFSRVTYCAYLVHPLVIRFLVMQTDHPIHLGKDMMAIIFLGQMVSSYLLSFVISLTFEAPIVTMLKILAPNKRKKIQ